MIQLISIHIAKTAGTSFYQSLSMVYGKHLDQRTKRIAFFPDGVERQLDESDFAPEIRAVHGHLRFYHIRSIYRLHHPYLIAWMRNPVDRVISNYYFMLNAVAGNPSHPHYSKRNYTLLEYANNSIPNKMCHYLEGISLDEIDFVGFQESFDADFLQLSGLFGWKTPLVPQKLNERAYEPGTVHYPTTPGQIDEAMRNKLSIINQQDMALYHKAEEYRQKNFWVHNFNPKKHVF